MVPRFCCTTNRRYGTIYVSRSTQIGKNNQVYLGQVAFPAAIGGAAESIERNVVRAVLFSFDTGTTDSEVRKVDSSISVDRDDVAFNAFVKQTEDVARTILFDITNSAETVLNTLKVYDGVVQLLSGACFELKFNSTCWSWWTCKTWVAVKKQVFGYVGEGSLNTLTGFRKFRERIYRDDSLLRDWFCIGQVESDFVYAAGTFLPTGAATETRYVPSTRAGTITLSENSLIQKFDAFPITTGGLSARTAAGANVIMPLHLVVSSVLDLETKHTQILMSVSEVWYYRRRFNYKRSIQNSHIYHHRLIILNKSEENGILSRITT